MSVERTRPSTPATGLSAATRARRMARAQAGLSPRGGPHAFSSAATGPMRRDYAIKRFLWLTSGARP